MDTNWTRRYATRTEKMKSSAIRDLLKVTEQPDVISFGGGLPSPESFPIQRFSEACERVLREHGATALQYGKTEGFTPLREEIARRAAAKGLPVTAENVLITTGSQQGLDLLGKIFVDRGSCVVVEAPTYIGALQAWNSYGAEYLTIETDEDGMEVERRLEAALRFRPKFIYVLPNFQNPAGVTLSLQRRRKLVELATRYGVPVVEDDPYGQLRFEGDDLPEIVRLDSDNRGNNDRTYDGNVIYMSTFSKILSPGIRLGWVIGPREVIARLVVAKQGTDLHTSSFVQMVACELEKDSYLDRHVYMIRDLYRERRDAMLAALDRYFPSDAVWTRPKGGLFLWCRLALGADTRLVLEEAVRRKVAFVPGTPFYPDGRGVNEMRLNFSFSSPDTIRAGIERLGAVLHEFCPLIGARTSLPVQSLKAV